jgi:hypothetical protein
MKNLLILIFAIGFPLLFVFCITELGGNTIDYWEYYIVKNENKIYKNEFGVFKIDSIGGYYTDLSIRLTGDSSFYFLAWGDRNSHMWNLKKDYNFQIDIPHRRFKGYDVSNDIKILKILKNKK